MLPTCAECRNIDFVRMAEATDGYTGSDIQNICNQASKASVTRRIREDPECKTENWMLTAEDFATAFRSVRVVRLTRMQ